MGCGSQGLLGYWVTSVYKLTPTSQCPRKALKVNIPSTTAPHLHGDLIGLWNNSKTSALLSSFFAFLFLFSNNNNNKKKKDKRMVMHHL